MTPGDRQGRGRAGRNHRQTLSVSLGPGDFLLHELIAFESGIVVGPAIKTLKTS